MRNLFVYEQPHPAHRAWAESVGCEIPEAPALSKPSFVEGLKDKDWYRRLSRRPMAVRATIDRTARDYSPPEWTPDVVVFEGWRQTACARHFPDSFKVLIGADWYPYVFHRDARMMSYLSPVDLVVSVSEVHKSFIPKEANPNVVIVHPSAAFEMGEIGQGRDCAFIGDVFETLKGVRHSVELFRSAFDDGRRFHVIGRCPPALEGTEEGGVKYWGRAPDDRLRELLRSSLYYLHWADFDPHPVSTVEAMSYGLLPVTSPTTGTHYLSQEVFGSQVDLSSVAAAARTLPGFDAQGDHVELREKCRRLSRNYTPERSKEQFRERVLEAYERWDGGGRASPGD